MNYTIDTFNLPPYEFSFAQWSHPSCSPKSFTTNLLSAQSSYISAGDIVIDIGAFTGDTPVLYGNATGPEGKVISFEANPHAYEILEANARLNPHLNILPVHKAITEKRGDYVFHYSDPGFCNGGFAQEIDRGVGATGHVVPLAVEGVNLTEWLEENLPKEDWGRISFIKIDTEGYDYKILRSNRGLFKEIRPIIEAELYPELSLREVEELYEVLQSLNYEVFQQHKGRVCSLESLTKSLTKKELKELFINIKSGEDIVAYPQERVPTDKLKKTMKISLIQPSRNNLKYLKWSYDSIRKNQGDHEVEICVADDFSHDGTWEWCQEMMDADPLFRAIRNDGPHRLGHTILYDKLINEVSTFDICMIYHADMYLCPKAIDSIHSLIAPGKIISLTRIEPDLHGDGPEKVLYQEGAVEPEDFNEEGLLEFLQSVPVKKNTNGIFAPWAFFKADFQAIGGHDPLYAPQSKEDSDIFNRFKLNGIEFIQTWNGYVYHMTCRGSRFNPTLTQVGKNSNEWDIQNRKSLRNFVRKWGSEVRHDPLLNPIVIPKYITSLKIENCTYALLAELEPYFSFIEVDCPIVGYISDEKPNTLFNLEEKVFQNGNAPQSGIQVSANGSSLSKQDVLVLKNLNQIILSNNLPLGSGQLTPNILISIRNLDSTETDLIFLKNDRVPTTRLPAAQGS